MRRLLIGFAIAAFSVASAASHKLTLFQPSLVGRTELKPGDYKLELKDNRVVISDRKHSVEVPVKVDSAERKFAATTVTFSNSNGKYRISEIRLGGTNTKLTLED